MSDPLLNPQLVIKSNPPTPTIEVENDEIPGQYASGEWQDLIAPFTSNWVKRKAFTKSATIWDYVQPSVSFLHLGRSVFIAQFGLPMSYFEELQRHLGAKLGKLVRFSDYAQPSRSDGWRPRIHVQDGAAWIPIDDSEWSKVS